MISRPTDGIFTGSTRQHKRLRLISVFAIIGTLFFFSYSFRNNLQLSPSARSTSRPQSQSQSQFQSQSGIAQPPTSCTVDKDVPQRYGLKGDVKYSRREILVDFTDKEALPISTPLDVELFNPAPVSLGENTPNKNGCSEPIVVKVPPPPAFRDASHVAFALSTNIDRLMDSMDAFAVWAGHTNARLLVYVEAGADQRPAMRKAKTLGLKIDLFESEVDQENRYSLLVKLLAENAPPTTKWFCIMDDDTFFMSMPRLLRMLEKYDDTQPHYIGALSESDAQVALFGIFAYGGAGTFISRPLMEELTQIWDECDSGMDHGDGKIAYCIYKFTNTKLEIDPGLHQIDLMSDASGWFEAARSLPVSIHHWKSYYDADAVKMTAVGSVCGPEGVLRQWRFADGWILTNGYSVIHHGPSVTEEHGLFAMEKTWVDINEASEASFMRALGPLRPQEYDKVSFRLEDIILEGGQVRQIYIHRSEGGDEVLDLVWRLNQ